MCKYEHVKCFDSTIICTIFVVSVLTKQIKCCILKTVGSS